jgi:hypothetical protein
MAWPNSFQFLTELFLRDNFMELEYKTQLFVSSRLFYITSLFSIFHSQLYTVTNSYKQFLFITHLFSLCIRGNKYFSC